MDGRVIDITKQLAYKQNAFNVIDSCITAEHFCSAERYVHNYYTLTEDYLGYHELNAYIHDTQVNTLYPQHKN